MTSSSEPAPWAPPDLVTGRCPDAPPGSWAHGAGTADAWSPPPLSLQPVDVPVEADAPDELAEAYERGRAKGIEEGVTCVRQELRPALVALGRVAEVLQAERANFAAVRERNLQAIALAVAGKLVQREVAADPDRVQELVGRALELLPLDTSLEVRLNPDDLALVQRLQDGDGTNGLVRAIQWVADPGLERGAFTLESPQRIVDGRFDVALRHLYDRLDHD
jgi:flagellar biosynthesis/type III secretory pathway protein FliH